MFTGTVDTGERFLMQQAVQTMLTCNFLQCSHNNVVLVSSHITLCVDRSQLMLCRSHLIVLCLGRNTQLPQFFIDIFHESGNSLTDRTKVMILQLLALRRHCTKQCTAGKYQVLSL